MHTASAELTVLAWLDGRPARLALLPGVRQKCRARRVFAGRSSVLVVGVATRQKHAGQRSADGSCRSRAARLGTPSQPDRHHLSCQVAKMILVTYKSDAHPLLPRGACLSDPMSSLFSRVFERGVRTARVCRWCVGMARLRGVTEDLIRVRLFFISYAPLWLMLACRAAPSGGWQWDARTAAVIVFGLLGVYGFVDAVRLIRGSGSTSIRSLVFGEVSDQGGNAAGYLATYLLPFIGLVPADWGDWAAYVLYFLVALIVFIRTDLTFVNPTLYILGHRVVSANAYLPGDRALVPGSPFVVVCRDPKALTSSRVVDVTSMAGGFITKDEPRIGREREQQNALRTSGGDLSASGREGRVEGD